MEQDFHIEERAGSSPPVIAVSGEIDVATAPQLRERLHGVIARGEATVVLDLFGVTFLDSTALGVLVGALKRCRELGGELHVVVADPRIVKIFEITGLTSVFTIADSLGIGWSGVTETTDRLESGDRVELRFPARGDLIVLARLVTSAISARAGFDIEELEDLRLAVGELCLLTLQGSDAQHGDLRLELNVLGDAIEVVCTLERAGIASALEPDGDDVARLSEQILDALVDEHGRESRDGSVRAWLRKRRGGHAE